MNYGPLDGDLAIEAGRCAECREPVGADSLTWMVPLELSGLPGALRGINLHQRCAITVATTMLRMATGAAAEALIEQLMD